MDIMQTTCLYHPSKSHPYKGNENEHQLPAIISQRHVPHLAYRYLFLLRPAIALVNLHTFLLDVAQSSLHLGHCGTVSCILAQVIAELHSRTAIGRGDLDDNVKRLRFFASGLVDVVIYRERC